MTAPEDDSVDSLLRAVAASPEVAPALAAGTRLGPYEIVELLGPGGMGDVYVARDTRLDRRVALKIVGAGTGSTGQRERAVRFEQEARAVAALSHPNIMAVYDVGATAAGAPYMVLELLEGETLRRRLARPMPAAEAVGRAVEIARGLTAAHARGIIHRDLKPDNLFLTTAGPLKILDFGLAKLATPALAGDVQTEAGAVLGTVGYMAPEQARGEPVDPRADLFSVGAILYEMLAGRQPFRAGSSVETLSAILKDEAAPLPDHVSPGLDRVVRRCLEKRREDRFQSAGDLAFSLESLDESTPARRRRPLRWAALAALALALAAGLAAAWPRAPARPALSYRRLTFRAGFVSAARFAHDGQTIVYSAAFGDSAPHVYAGSSAGPESRSLALPSWTRVLAISPTDELAVLVFPEVVSRAGTLARVPLAGGSPRAVAERVTGADWTAGGELAVVRDQDVELPIGHVLHHTSGRVDGMRVSPRGDQVAFIEHPVGGEPAGRVAVVDREGHARTLTRLWSRAHGLAWGPGGEIWYTAGDVGRDEALRAVTVDGRDRLLDDAPADLQLEDVAPDGRALLASHRDVVVVKALAPGETVERDLSWFDMPCLADLSDDGRRVLLVEKGDAARTGYRTYLRTTDGVDPVFLGPGIGEALSPDGKWALLRDLDRPELLTLVPTGPGTARALAAGPLVQRSHARWFPDGQRVLYTGVDADGRSRLYVQDLDGPPRAASPPGLHLEPANAIAPDGKRALAWTAEDDVVILPLDGDGAATPLPGLDANETVAGWSSDGRIFAYRRAPPLRITLIDPATGRREAVRELATTSAVIRKVMWLLVTPDGRSYAYMANEPEGQLYLGTPVSD